MSKTIVKENKDAILLHYKGIQKFKGCQCIKDCSCQENFKDHEYDYYVIRRKDKKTTIHATLDDANNRWDFIKLLQK